MVFAEQPPNNSQCRDPDGIHTLRELAAAFDVLRGTRTYTGLIKAATELPPRQGRQPALSKATLNALLRKAESVPAQDTVVTFLTVCGVHEADQRPWLAAWERVKTSHLRRPAGAVRVREADPRLLGVHASIQVDPGVDDLPPYVPRDFDAELCTAVTAAASTGGMVLLSGGSSVGKTRALCETVRAVLPEWWLLHPTDAAEIRAAAQAPPPRTVVWLDELQRYLDQPDGLSAGLMRSLLAAGAVVLATLWPDEVTIRTAPRMASGKDRHAEDRELLKLARIIDVPTVFSIDERRRAKEFKGDGRIRTALEHAIPGFTQVLAAGPALIRRWKHAPASECCGQAVITAALDARRAGARAPLTVGYLKMAAPAYLTPVQQATAAADWFERAINYATAPVHGATSCLIPVPAGMGQIAGYNTADYLYQSLRTTRGAVAIPDQVWQALVTHHPENRWRLARNAERQGRVEHAMAFYRLLAAAGDGFAAVRLAGVLIHRGRTEEATVFLRHRVEAGDGIAAVRLAELLAGHGQLEEAITLLHQRVDVGDGIAAGLLAEVLARHGQMEEAILFLQQRANAGDGIAAGRLARMLAAQKESH